MVENQSFKKKTIRKRTNKKQKGGMIPAVFVSNRLAEIISAFTSTAASVAAEAVATEEKKKDNPQAAIIATSVVVRE